MRVPIEMRNIYGFVLKQNMGLMIENLDWAYPPQIHRLHVYDIKSNTQTKMVIGMDFANNLLDSIVRTYLVQPGEIRQIRV